MGGAVGRQDVEAAPGSQPDFCPGAPAHPSHPLRGHPSIAADTNFSAFRAPQFWSSVGVSSPSANCLPQGRLIIQRRAVGARNSDFIGKAVRPRRWETGVARNHLPHVRIQASHPKRGGGKSRFRPDSRGDVFISSFPAAIHRWAWSGSVP